MLIDPVDILEADKFADVKKKMETIAVGKNGEKRIDRIATICTRLYLHLKNDAYKPEENHKENLVEFMFILCMKFLRTNLVT